MTFKLSPLANAVHIINNGNRPFGALIVEIPTDIGRSYAGYKRGGILEGAEKFRKEVMAACVWLLGIPAFKWAGDKIFEKLFKIPMDIDFSLGDLKQGNAPIEDSVEFLTKKTKEEAKNFLEQKKKNGGFFDISALPSRYFKETGESIFAGMDTKKMIKSVKNAKIATSVLAFVLNVLALGVALPLINQAMTRKKMAKINKEKEHLSTFKPESFESFRNRTKKSAEEKNKSVSFKGTAQAMLSHPMATFVDLIENSSTFRLVAPDAPMIAGRIKTSRNRYEAIENAFVDVSGIYLYNFCADNIQSALRKISKNPDISPALGELIASKDNALINDAIQKLIKENKTLTAQELFNKDIANEIYEIATYGKYGKINRFVKHEKLKEIDASVCNFLLKLKKLKGDVSEISKEDIYKLTKTINSKNEIFLAIGLFIAILGQAYLIPKIAYKITEKLTGKNQFTGIADYSNNDNKGEKNEN